MDTTLKTLEQELAALDKDLVEIDGTLLKPSQCYHFEKDPLHLLFNTNCPETLKQKVEAIVGKHIPSYEISAPEQGTG
jgi:hypothetical protein